MPIHGNLAPGLTVGTAVVANFDREFAALTGATGRTGEVVEPTFPLSGLLQQFTSEGQTAGAAVGTTTQPPLIGSSAAASYQAAAAVHGGLGIQMSGSAPNVRLRAPGHSYRLSWYGFYSAMAAGTYSALNLSDEPIATTIGTVQFVATSTTVGHFQVVIGAGSQVATGTIAPGDQFRFDLDVAYAAGTLTLTLGIYYWANIEGTTPDETLTVSRAVTTIPPWIRFGTATGADYNIDTIRITDSSTPFTPFNPTLQLSGSGSLSAAATPAFAVTPGLGGSGSLAVTPVVGVSGSAGLSGDGTLAVSGVPSPAVSPALSGSGVLTVTTRTPGLVVTPVLGGSGTLSVAATPATSGTPALSGSGTLAVTTKTPAVSTTPALSGTGTLAVTARTPAVSGAPALGGTGTLNASTGSAGSGTPALNGSGALVAAGTPAFATTPGLAGTGTLTVTALLAASSPATFSGGGVLAALAQMAISTSLAFLGSGDLTAARVSTGILTAVLVAQPPDDDPGAVASAHALGPDAWLNRRHVRHGVDTWLGPVVTRADAVLNLAVTAGATPGDSDWTAPFYVAGRPGYLLHTPGSTGRYHLWCRDGITGDPSPFATITVT